MRIDTMREIFMRMHEYEFRSGCIMNTAMHTIIMTFLIQINDLKILNTNEIKVIDMDHPKGWRLPASSFTIPQVEKQGWLE